MAGWRSSTFSEDFEKVAKDLQDQLAEQDQCGFRCRAAAATWSYDPSSPKLEEHYELGDRLGAGTYGVVWAAKLCDRVHRYARYVLTPAQRRLSQTHSGFQDTTLGVAQTRKEAAAMRLANYVHVQAWLTARMMQHRDATEHPFACKEVNIDNDEAGVQQEVRK